MEDLKLILIIEDDTVLLENTRELLEFSNFKIITAANGKMGIENALKHLPDLILCDILMPEIDGYEVLNFIRSKPPTKNIPFLFFSAKNDNSDIREGMNLRADDYITKPYKERDLIDAINRRLLRMDSIHKSYSQKSMHLNAKISSLEDFKNLLKTRGEKCTYKKRTTIYYENENANFIYLIEEGILKTVKIDNEGKELITGLYKENNLFGLTSFKSSSYYDETAIAIDNVMGYRLSSKSFRELISDNPELMIEIAEILSENISGLKEHMLEMAYGSVLKKTTQTILEFAQNTKEDPKTVINITRTELAHVAGISTESFIRSLSHLRKKNIIEVVGRNIKILDFDKLKKMQ